MDGLYLVSRVAAEKVGQVGCFDVGDRVAPTSAPLGPRLASALPVRDGACRRRKTKERQRNGHLHSIEEI